MKLLDLLFPPTCVLCKKSGSYICTNCLAKVSVAPTTCIGCGKSAVDGLTHAGCKRSYLLDSAMAIWRYEGVVRKALLSMKYRYASDIGAELAKLAVTEIKKARILLPSKAILVPIPLHRARQNWRGFNQVEEIGRRVAVSMGWGYTTKLLSRQRLTVPQTGLKRSDRTKNILGVFTANKNHPLHSNYDTPLILFDDVQTTGSTLREAGKVLKRSGFKTVWGFALAK